MDIEAHKQTASGHGSNNNSKIGLGCLILFALPFAGMGLLALAQGVLKLQAGKTKDGVILCLVGSVFTLVGSGLMIGGYYGMRLERARAQRKAAHPAQPWRWREDWEQGRVDSQNKAGAIALWAFAIVWNLISSSVFFALPQELAKGNKGILVALIFPVIGMCLLFGAIYLTLQRRKYGQPVFKLLNTPCVIGGQAAGLVEIPAKVKATSGFKVRLQCVEKMTSGSGKNRSTRETVLWQDHTTVSQDLLAHQMDKTGIPVQFTIPASAPEASPDSCNPSIHWRLTVEADVPGVDLNETFELPVFRTAESPTPAAGEVLHSAPRWEKPVESYTPPINTRVRVQSLPSGGCRVEFPAARNIGVIVGMLFFTLVFGGALAALIIKKAPILFPIVFGFVVFLLVLGILNMLLHASRVEADVHGVRLHDSWVFCKKESRYLAGEIADVDLKNGMQSGKKVYYDIQLRLTSGRAITLGSSVPDGQHAAWIAAVIKQAAGTPVSDPARR